MNDPSRIPVPQTPPPPLAAALAQTIVPVPPIDDPSPRSLNKWKYEGLRIVLEEKILSTHGMVDRNPIVWDTFICKRFEFFTKPYGLYIPTWVWEFYSTYSDLVS